ncbi:LPXTG cell wall anchor domain-containing protein [Isoptericola dokdonensis]|uniref:Gram-positive cocci surface proteins LPxTG domain-containing protein n=1 Tax=Isoptericola dokdonensis DS-3 TaxID=1300344 RepID=A0A161IIB6_9MICO|nr:LPXTG cell wall anchor domain-containing protein [Isoptericola dokdonensis]ANC31634.1 hypothetical protein I598_2092 [Isoptericola dokdonensis DS-3]
MKALRTVTVSAVSTALALGVPLTAFAAEGDTSPATAPTSSAPAEEQAAEPTEESTEESGTQDVATSDTSTESGSSPAPVDPVVAPAPEEPTDAAAPEEHAEDVEDAEDADESAPAVEPAEDAAEEPASDEQASDDATDEADAPADEASPSTDTDEPPAPEATEATEEATAPVATDATDAATTQAPQASALAASAGGATALSATQASYPDSAYEPHWHDGGQDGFGCDYWYFLDPVDGGSGKDWSGWGGTPQLHILHHTLVDDDGTVHMVYDRDIAGSWYHAWSGDETVSPDPDGIHWENTSAQQTILVNGYQGGNDMTARAADAQRLFDRAGVAVSPRMTWEAYLGQYQSSIDAGSFTEAQVREWFDAEIGNRMEQRLDYTAYEATQFAVWYFSTGHDVMGLMFDVDENDHVTISDKALQQFEAMPYPEDGNWDGYDSTRDWASAYNSDRMATLQTAAWLIEQALTANVVMPQPGFVSDGYVKRADGATDYGFTASLVGGTGDVHVELRTADGSAMPEGVVLVDGQGRVVDSVTPGQKVFVRVPAGMSVADLPAFQLWGSAQGTQQGSPHFYTGMDHTNNGGGTTDPETGEWTPSEFQHWFIGLGELDRPTTAWDWIGVTLADEPEQLVDPVDPTDPVDPADPSDPTEPVDPADLEDPQEGPQDPADPRDPGTTDGRDDTGTARGTHRDGDTGGRLPVAPIYVATGGDVVEGGADATDPANIPAAAETATVTGPQTLPRTGADADASLLAAAAAITLAGTGLVLASRRRTGRADDGEGR